MSDGLQPKHWPYRADIPQRYADNAALYRARGGKVRLEEDAAGFVADGNVGNMSRFYFLCLMQDQIAKERLDGDLAEVGVYKGATASVLARVARRKGAKLWLFDTFAGFHPGDLKDVDADKPKDRFADAPLDFVRERLGDDGVTYVQGRFPETSDQVPPDLRFCAVHIDCNLYEPIRAALAYFYPRMVPGGFLLVHDYSSLAWNGAERAVDEFFADKPESVTPLTDGSGSCVVRRVRDPAKDVHWSRRPLPFGVWVDAADDGLGAAIGKGWSASEPWGIWGVGEAHTLTMPPGTQPIRLEVDCSVAMLGPTEWQAVTISAAGAAVDVWQFTRTQNRGVRSVTIPPGKKGAPVTVTFNPSDPLLRPCDFNKDSKDDRALGLAVHRVRLNG